MNIVVAEKEIRRFRRHGIASYPNERIGWLLGRNDGTTLYVDKIVESDQVSTEDYCEVGPEAYAEMQRNAVDAGLLVLGNVHTHPDFIDATPSENDHGFAKTHGWKVIGIIGVVKREVKMRSRLKWWLATEPLTEVLK